MSNMVTRCPKCATAFRITSAQLQSAKGAVRCGSCLHIFRAQDHLVSGPQPGPSAAISRQPATNAPKPATGKPITKPAVPSARPAPVQAPAARIAPAHQATPAQQPGTRSSQSAVKPANHPAPEPVAQTKNSKPAGSAPGATAPAGKAAVPAVEPDKPSTEKLAFNQQQIDHESGIHDDDLLISDDMDSPAKPEERDYSFDGFLDIPASRQSVSLFERNARDLDADDDEDAPDADESWAESLLEEADEDNKIAAIKQEIEASEQPAPPPATADIGHREPLFNLIGEVPVTEPDEADIKEIFTEAELSQELRAITDEDVANANASSAPISAYDTSRAALLMNIMPEPVEMTASSSPNWRRKKLWPLLALGMFLLLVAQVAWLQFDHLSRIQPYRAAYEVVCPWLGCELPVLVDRSQIRVRNLVVRKHPEAENALMVDLILINSAPFRQPFPNLSVAFSNLAGEPVASRRFLPTEYLGGELAGAHLMPQNQPIYITLELVDPGEAAVNYKIDPI